MGHEERLIEREEFLKPYLFSFQPAATLHEVSTGCPSFDLQQPFMIMDRDADHISFSLSMQNKKYSDLNIQMTRNSTAPRSQRNSISSGQCGKWLVSKQGSVFGSCRCHHTSIILPGNCEILFDCLNPKTAISC